MDDGAMNEEALKQRVRELSGRGYSTYTISVLMGITPSAVGRLRGVFVPSKKPIGQVGRGDARTKPHDPPASGSRAP